MAGGWVARVLSTLPAGSFIPLPSLGLPQAQEATLEKLSQVCLPAGCRRPLPTVHGLGGNLLKPF